MKSKISCKAISVQGGEDLSSKKVQEVLVPQIKAIPLLFQDQEDQVMLLQEGSHLLRVDYHNKDSLLAICIRCHLHSNHLNKNKLIRHCKN